MYLVLPCSDEYRTQNRRHWKSRTRSRKARPSTSRSGKTLTVSKFEISGPRSRRACVDKRVMSKGFIVWNWVGVSWLCVRWEQFFSGLSFVRVLDRVSRKRQPPSIDGVLVFTTVSRGTRLPQTLLKPQYRISQCLVSRTKEAGEFLRQYSVKSWKNQG